MTIFTRKYGVTVLLAVLVVQTVLIVGFAAGYVNLASQNRKQNDDIQATLDRGRQIIECLTDYTTQLQVALEDRDTVNATTRAATKEWVSSIRDLVISGSNNPTDFFTVTDTYLTALDRVDHSVRLNPYPKIIPCLQHVPGQQVAPVLRLIADHSRIGGQGYPGKWDNKCLHRKVTIRGNDGNNNISGTNGSDVIFAYSGNDIVDGGPGRDRICGRFGGDTLTGGTGFDRINGGNGGGIDLCFAERTKKCP